MTLSPPTLASTRQLSQLPTPRLAEDPCRALVVATTLVAEVRAFARSQPGAVTDLEDLDPAALAWPCRRLFGSLLHYGLERGKGYRHLSLPPDHGLTNQEMRLLFLAIGTALGDPIGTARMQVVEAQALAHDGPSPASPPRAQPRIGSDSSLRSALPDFVGLLCERPSPNAAVLVSSAMRVRRKIAHHAPAAWRLLQEEYVCDPGAPGTETAIADLLLNRIPVFADDDRPAGWTFRYARANIERGHQRAGLQLATGATAVFDMLDELLADPEHVNQIHLGVGDMLWINNRTLAHDRSALIADPSTHGRHWRMWVASPSG